MNLKSNQILIGIILLIVGAAALFQNIHGFSLGNLSYLIAGGAFLLLYRTKRKYWSLMLGVLLSSIGVSRVLSAFFGLYTSTAAMFFLIPAIIFLVLYLDKNKQKMLLPGMVLLWFGIFLAVRNMAVFYALPFNLFFMCMGAAFFCVYFMGKGYIGRWPIYLGILLLLLGGILRIPFFPVLFIMVNIPVFISLAVICAGVYIIIKAFFKKGE